MRRTVQKDIIKKIVSDASDHPTAETIYDRCRVILPNISLGTVYRNLNGLVEKGEVKHIAVPCAQDHFDKTVVAHSHFLCKVCGQMTDIMDENLHGVEEYVEKLTGNRVEGGGILFEGICKSCLQKQKDNAAKK